MKINRELLASCQTSCSKESSKIRTLPSCHSLWERAGGEEEEGRRGSRGREEEGRRVSGGGGGEEEKQIVRRTVPDLVGAADPAAMFGDDQAQVHPQPAVSGTSVRPHVGAWVHDGELHLETQKQPQTQVEEQVKGQREEQEHEHVEE